jgi:hypothetical protein
MTCEHHNHLPFDVYIQFIDNRTHRISGEGLDGVIWIAMYKLHTEVVTWMHSFPLVF